MPKEASSKKQRNRSTSPVRKQRSRSKSPDRKRVSLRRLAPGKDYPMFIAPDPSVQNPSLTWAQQHGYGHIKELSRSDANTILDRLRLSDQEAHDAFAAMIFGNPWYWLEAYAKADGHFDDLHIQCKK